MIKDNQAGEISIDSYTTNDVPKNIYVEIETILDTEGDPLLAISFFFKNELQHLKLSEFLSFIYQNETLFSDEEADFCYALARLTKVSPHYPGKFCVIGQDNLCIFFTRALDFNIPLYWVFGDRKMPLVFSSLFPVRISVQQKGLGIKTKLETDLPSLGSSTFYYLAYEKMGFIILNDLVHVCPSLAFSEYLLDMIELKQTIYRTNEECSEFLTFITNYEALLDWNFINIEKEVFIATLQTPIPILKLEYDQESVSCQILFQYASEIIGFDFKETTLRNITNGHLISRDMAFEAQCQSNLMTIFTKFDIPFFLDNPKHIHLLISKGVPELKKDHWLIQSNIPDFELAQEPMDLEFSISSSGQDWFQFDPNCSIHGEPHSLQEIARLMISNHGFIKTKKGYVQLSEKTQKELNFMVNSKALQIGKDISKRDVFQFLSVTNTTSDDPDVMDLIKQVKEDDVISAEPGDLFKGQLRDYQLDGLKWMHFLFKHKFGGILADDMGLGKTVQVLAFISNIVQSATEVGKPSLIVGPSNVIYNWEQEAKKFLPGLKVHVYTGQSRKESDLDKYHILVTSYGIIKNDLTSFQKRKWSMIVLDEAQQIKNSKSQNHIAVKAVDADFKLALSGTPVENSSADLWSICNFALPNYFGPLTQFQTYSETSPDYIKNRLRPFMLRRTKKEVLEELPDKTEIDIKVDLNKAQQDLYKTIIDAAKKGIRNLSGKNDRLHILTSIMKLRQLCLHPRLLKEVSEGIDVTSEKFEIVKQKLSELIKEGHKIVVFTQFTGMLDLLTKWCAESSINVERIDGTCSPKQRIAAVNRFQNEKKPTVFAISLKAGGVGITLTSADYVFHLDPWWNPAIENQATDRVHRMGQKNHVMVYKFIARGTIEEKIIDLQNKKRSLYDSLIGDGQGAQESNYMEDLKQILLE